MTSSRLALPALVFALVLAACAGARASALWPHVRVASAYGAHAGKCANARVRQLEAVLRSLTAVDFNNWRMPCLCQPMTLSDALYDAQGGRDFTRYALHVTLSPPVVDPAPWIPGQRRPLTDSLVLVRVAARGNTNTMVFFGTPKPPGLKIQAAVVYTGWGLKGDPFRLTAGECAVH